MNLVVANQFALHKIKRILVYQQNHFHFESDDPMLRLAVVFLVIAIIVAVFGFGGVAAVATDAARILFFVFIVLFLITLVVGRKGLNRK